MVKKHMKDIRKETNRKRRWNEKNIKNVKVTLNVGSNERDQAIATFLDNQENKSEAIKKAIDEYMKFLAENSKN